MYLSLAKMFWNGKERSVALKDSKIYVRIFVNFLLTITSVVLGIIFIPRLFRFFLPFVVAFIISSIANPVVRFLEKRIKIVRKHGSAITIVLALGLVVGLLYVLISAIVREFFHLLADMPRLMEKLMEIAEKLSQSLNGLYAFLPENMQSIANSMELSMKEMITGILSEIKLPSLSNAGNYVKNFADILLFLIVTLLASYFFMIDRDKIGAKLKSIMPASVLQCYTLIIENIKVAFGGYFKAQFKIMMIITFLLFIGLELLKIDYSFFIAVFIAFLDLLPVFGTGTIIWPWIIIDLLTGAYKQAIVLGVLYLVCQVVKQLLQPKMVGDSIGMSPLATLFFMFVGYRVSGVFGMILGIPVGMALIRFYELGMFDRLIRGAKIVMRDINNFRKY